MLHRALVRAVPDPGRSRACGPRLSSLAPLAVMSPDRGPPPAQHVPVPCLTHKGHSAEGVPNYYRYGPQMCGPPLPARPEADRPLMALELQQQDEGRCRGIRAGRQEQTGFQVGPQGDPRHGREQEL